MPKHNKKNPEVVESSDEKETELEYFKKGCCNKYNNDHNNHCDCRSNGSFWGVLIIFVGVTLFLNNAGLIPWSFWDNIWQFWPLVLVIIGLRIVLGCTPGCGLIITLASFLILFSLWVKILININSPLVYQWHLDQLPWFNFLINLNFSQ